MENIVREAFDRVFGIDPSERQDTAACALRLKITEKELVALVETRNDLATGELQHEPLVNLLMGTAPKRDRTFNMRIAVEQTPCGTACCIGGDMAIRMGLHGKSYVSDSRGALSELFHPIERGGSAPLWDRITPKQAVQAIDNFLKDGNPRWKEIIG